MNKALKLLRPWIAYQFSDQVTDAAERLDAFCAFMPGTLPEVHGAGPG